MKTKYIFLSCVAMTMLFVTTSLAQYSSNEAETAIFLKSLEFELYHGKAPDSLINKTKTDITVEIRDVNGNMFPGLQQRRNQGGQPDTTFSKDLNAGAHKEINTKHFRKGTGANKMVELVITIPGIKNVHGEWDIKQVKWNLGKDHNPTYTKLNYLGREQGYEIIIVYENGVPPRSEEKSLQHKRIHFDGHICDPDDELCGG